MNFRFFALISFIIVPSYQEYRAIKETQAKYVADWSVPLLCEKVNEDNKGKDDNLFALVPLNLFKDTSNRPKYFHPGCYLLEAKKFKGDKKGLIDPNGLYFVPRKYASIFHDKKIKCDDSHTTSHRGREKIPKELIKRFTGSWITALQALQICKFNKFGHSEKLFRPNFIPLMLNLESYHRCVRWGFEVKDGNNATWVRKTIPAEDCVQPKFPKNNVDLLKARSEATCQIEEEEILCKSINKTTPKIKRYLTSIEEGEKNNMATAENESKLKIKELNKKSKFQQFNDNEFNKNDKTFKKSLKAINYRKYVTPTVNSKFENADVKTKYRKKQSVTKKYAAIDKEFENNPGKIIKNRKSSSIGSYKKIRKSSSPISANKKQVKIFTNLANFWKMKKNQNSINSNFGASKLKDSRNKNVMKENKKKPSQYAENVGTTRYRQNKNSVSAEDSKRNKKFKDYGLHSSDTPDLAPIKQNYKIRQKYTSLIKESPKTDLKTLKKNRINTKA